MAVGRHFSDRVLRYAMTREDFQGLWGGKLELNTQALPADAELVSSIRGYIDHIHCADDTYQVLVCCPSFAPVASGAEIPLAADPWLPLREKRSV